MNTPIKVTRLALAIGAAAAFAVACDFQKTANQATAPNVVVATLLTTPRLEIKPEAVALGAFDASIPSFDAGGFDLDGGFTWDGGFPADAGLPFSLDAGLSVPPQTLVVVFFGERQGSSLDVQPKGIAGATVTITEVGGKTWPLAETGGGSYMLVGEDAGFTYASGATYDFDVTNAGQKFTAELVKAPAAETIPQFHPAAGYIDLDAGQPFSFTRPDPPAGEERALGFVTVYPVSSDSQKGEPTYTNIPKTPLDFLKLIAAPSLWKQTANEIPGTAFPLKDRNYLIILQSAKLGGPKSENLFSGSAILGGTAEIGIVKTKK